VKAERTRGATKFFTRELLIARRDWRAGLVAGLLPLVAIAVIGVVGIFEGGQFSKQADVRVTVAVPSADLGRRIVAAGDGLVKAKVLADPALAVLTGQADISVAESAAGGFVVGTSAQSGKTAYALPLVTAAVDAMRTAKPPGVDATNVASTEDGPASSAEDLAKGLLIVLVLTSSGFAVTAAGLLAIESDGGELEAALVLPVDRRTMLLGMLGGQMVVQLLQSLLYLLIVGVSVVVIAGYSQHLSLVQRVTLPLVVVYGEILLLVGLGAAGLLLGGLARGRGRAGAPGASAVSASVTLLAGLSVVFTGWERTTALLVLPVVGAGAMVERAALGEPVVGSLVLATLGCAALFAVATQVVQRALRDGASRSRAV